MKSPSHILILHCKEKYFQIRKTVQGDQTHPFPNGKFSESDGQCRIEAVHTRSSRANFKNIFRKTRGILSRIVGFFNSALKRVQPFFIFVHSIRARLMIQLTIHMEPLKHLLLIRHPITIQTFIPAPLQMGTSSAPPTMSSWSG